MTITVKDIRLNHLPNILPLFSDGMVKSKLTMGQLWPFLTWMKKKKKIHNNISGFIKDE